MKIGQSGGRIPFTAEASSHEVDSILRTSCLLLYNQLDQNWPTVASVVITLQAHNWGNSKENVFWCVVSFEEPERLAYRNTRSQHKSNSIHKMKSQLQITRRLNKRKTSTLQPTVQTRLEAGVSHTIQGRTADMQRSCPAFKTRGHTLGDLLLGAAQNSMPNAND